MQYGPARTVEQSTTRRPASGPGRRVRHDRSMVAADVAGDAATVARQPIAERSRSPGHDAPDPTPDPHRPTLMTVHAHPDDETIGTGGAMAKAVAAGHRVVLVTCTRGELGEIVVPEMDTPENHRRLGEIRAGELERAMGVLGVTEWENLGYRDSGMMGRPATTTRAASGRPTWTRRPAAWSGSSAATSRTS